MLLIKMVKTGKLQYLKCTIDITSQTDQREKADFYKQTTRKIVKTNLYKR
jgi:hypothetical protein